MKRTFLTAGVAFVAAGLLCLAPTRAKADLTADIATDSNDDVLNAEQRLFTDSTFINGIPNGSVLLFIVDTGDNGTPVYGEADGRLIHPDSLFDEDDMALFTATAPGPSLFPVPSSQGKYLDLGHTNITDVAIGHDIYVVVWNTLNQGDIGQPGGSWPVNHITCDVGFVGVTAPAGDIGNYVWLIQENLHFDRYTITDDPFWIDSVDLGDDWHWLDWFGYFSVKFDPWIYHEQHGWMYPFGPDPGHIWFYEETMDTFLWTADTVYPYVYRWSDGAWLYYLPDSVNPRWFYNFSTALWEEW